MNVLRRLAPGCFRLPEPVFDLLLEVADRRVAAMVAGVVDEFPGELIRATRIVNARRFPNGPAQEVLALPRGSVGRGRRVGGPSNRGTRGREIPKIRVLQDALQQSLASTRAGPHRREVPRQRHLTKPCARAQTLQEALGLEGFEPLTKRL